MRRRQEPETLTLSEPAATLWRGVRKMLADLRGTDGVAPGDWQIGGSSILAARWRHRRSTDIELSTSGATEQEKLPKNVRNGLAEWPSNIGKTRHRRNGSVVEITFGSTGRLLVRTTRPAPRLGHTTAIVDGEPFETLSTTQILAGKLLGRNAVPPAEDLYDIAAAGEHDPGSLAQAVNMLSARSAGRHPERMANPPGPDHDRGGRTPATIRRRHAAGDPNRGTRGPGRQGSRERRLPADQGGTGKSRQGSADQDDRQRRAGAHDRRLRPPPGRDPRGDGHERLRPRKRTSEGAAHRIAAVAGDAFPAGADQLTETARTGGERANTRPETPDGRERSEAEKDVLRSETSTIGGTP